jgi:hypothetical protein
VSLVLEALRKLDREKGRDERGFVVMAAAPWPTRARRGPLWLAAGVAALAASAAVFLMMRPPRPSASALPAASAAAAASPSAPPASPTPAATSVPFPTPATRRAATPAPVPPSTPVAEPRDPTPLEVVGNGRKIRSSPAASPAAAPALRLQAVSERDGQPIALVNDRILRVGDEIEGMKVLAIRPDEVDLEIKGRRTTLRF